MLSESSTAMVTDHPDNPVKCEALTKPLICLHYLLQDKKLKINDPIVIKILNSILLEYFGRNFPSDEKLTYYFKIENKEVLKKIDF